MSKDHTSIYNNLIKLTRNKSLYLNLVNEETFSDRLIFLLLHLSFFIKIYKDLNSKKLIQEIHDFIFKQIEISIREIGYGDVSINKNMKKYVNYFYDIVSNIDNWDELDNPQKSSLLERFINKPKNTMFFVIYFDNLTSFYKKNTLNYFTKDIEETLI
tara:strand:+ start:1088 stop:1561 length:474 start_codon:yes stop_codon:yes gene_type:complete